MPETIPDKMRTVVLSEYREDVYDAIRGLQVLERPIPKLRRGQVLVKMSAAPCNPSDLLLLQGRYGTLKTLAHGARLGRGRHGGRHREAVGWLGGFAANASPVRCGLIATARGLSTLSRTRTIAFH